MFHSARTRAVVWTGTLLCLGLISSQGQQPLGDASKGEATSKDADKGEVTSGGTDKREASVMDTDVANKGLKIFEFLTKYNSSSNWSGKYTAEKAMLRDGGYWCSKKNDKAPLYWWISFNKPVQIFQIGFLETYTARPDLWATDKAASYEFYGSDTAACSKTGKTLIYGTRSEIVGKNFNNGVNGQAYHCYGLKVTKLADTRDTRKHRYGPLATLKNFGFSVKGFSKTYFNGKFIGMPGKFFKRRGMSYILFEKETTWTEASKICLSLKSGWYIAYMWVREEYDEVTTKLQELRNSEAVDSCQDSWIGLEKKIDRWRWVFGPPRKRIVGSHDERWAAGEPKVDDSANAAFVRVEGSQAKLVSSNRVSDKVCSFLCRNPHF